MAIDRDLHTHRYQDLIQRDLCRALLSANQNGDCGRPLQGLARARRKRDNNDRDCPWTTELPTAMLVLADGTVIEGKGIGATGKVQAEVCFNTALTGYEEILTDPPISAKSSPSLSRISAMSAPMTRTSRI